MKRLAARVVLMTVIFAGMYTDVFALSDSYLNTIRDGFGGRRDQMLSSQVSGAYPDPCSMDTGTAVWGLQDYALSALYQHDASPAQIATANQAIIDACWRAKKDNSYYTGVDQESFHWCGNLFFRLYEFFNHNAQDPNFRGRLTPAAEAAICDIFWNYAKWNSVAADANTQKSHTWYIWGSENHGTMRYSTNYSAAAILKDVAPYNTYTYNDGKTALQHYNAWNSFFKEYFLERAKKGLLVEIGSHTYSKYTLQSWYNFYDFAQDANLAKLAGMGLDLWWADWAHDQINGVRGGGKARVYQLGADVYAASDDCYSLCWYYFGFGVTKSKAPSMMCLATSAFRLPLVVMDLALDMSGRGTYEYKSRRMGLNLIPQPSPMPTTYVLDPNYGGLYRYTYITPSFVMGTLMMEKRSESNWSDISDQNRWHGVIFSSNVDARIVPQCVGTDSSHRNNNQAWSVQNKGTLIVQKLSTSTSTGARRVYFSKNPMKFAAVDEESGWVFVNATNAYAAVKPATGTYSWDDPNWIKMSDQYAAVIIEVAESKDYTDFTAFKTAVKALPLTVVNNVVTYTGLKDNGTFTFYTNATTLPQINGVPINLKPTFTFDSPFMHEDWASGNITIHKDGRTCQMDFNNIVENVVECGDWGYLPGDLNTDCSVDMSDLQIITNNWLCFDSWLGDINSLPPFNSDTFTDSSTTVALWHMDSTYTGTDNIVRVADDDAINTRNHELLLGSARAGYSATTRPTLSTLGFNGTGGCLLFDGVNDESIATNAWTSYDSVLVDAWIYPLASSGSYLIVEASSTWSLSIQTNKLNFTTYHSDGSSDSYNWTSDISLNTWHHVRAVMTKDGQKQLTLDGITNVILTGGPSIKVQTKDIMVGKKTAATWYFNGYIDEIRVASIDPAGYRSGTVNLRDWAIVAQDWLKCTDPANAACQAGL